MQGVRSVLYRLPELRGKDTVYLVEGERDANALWALGIPATTNPGGVGKSTAELTAQLVTAGVRDVVMLPDNDPPGEAHARAIERSCLEAKLGVKIVRLPDLPPKGDVPDWLAGGHIPEELAWLQRHAPATTLDPACVPGGPQGSADGPVLLRLADVEAESVSWHWPGRLARGKLTLLAGDPGLGKSLLTIDVGARVSTAREWPDGGRAPLGDFILLTAEDGIADTVRPRLDALRGDAARIHVLRAVRHGTSERPFSLAADLPALESAITATSAVLVVIDPLSAYLGKTDSYKGSEVRGLLAPLAALAERRGVAVLVVMHLTKDSQRRAIHRTGGSIGFVGAPRVALAVGKDPDDEERRLLCGLKSNLTAPPATLAYRIMGLPDGSARVEWEPEPVAGVDVDALLGQGAPEDREERREADELLRELLTDGEQPAAAVIAAAQANSIALRTLNRAKRRLGIITRHEGQPRRKGGAWYWSLPAPEWPPKGATPSPKDAARPTVASFEEPSGKTAEVARTCPKGATSRDMAPFGGTLRDGAPEGAKEVLDPWTE